MLIDLLIDFGV